MNDPELLRQAMVVLEKGTNRFDFLQGRVNKYAWCDKGKPLLSHCHCFQYCLSKPLTMLQPLPSQPRSAMITVQTASLQHIMLPVLSLPVCASVCAPVWLTSPDMTGGSFVMSEVASAILSAQLQIRPMLIDARVTIFNKYHAAFAGLEESGKLQRPIVPAECTYNGHIYYIRIKSKEHFDKLAVLSKHRKIGIFTHYEALHASTGGELFGRNSGSLDETVRCCEQLYRMPMWVGLTDDEIQKGVECVQEALA